MSSAKLRRNCSRTKTTRRRGSEKNELGAATGANVRIRIGNLVTSDLKLSLVKRSSTLDEVFKIAKATFKSKKNKTRAV